MSSPSNELSYVNPTYATTESILPRKASNHTLTDEQAKKIKLILSDIIPGEFEISLTSNTRGRGELYVFPIECVEKWRKH